MNQQNNSFVSIDEAIDNHLAGQGAPETSVNAPDPSETSPPEQAGAEAELGETPAEQAQDAPSPDADPGEPDLADVIQDDIPPTDVPTTIPLKVNGEVQELTVDEIQKGYMQQADYTRKTQDMADKRRQVEAEAQQLAQQREQYVSGLQQMAQALHAQEPPEPDPLLRDTDPVSYLEAQEARRQHRERMDGLNRAYQDEMTQAQEAQRQALNQQVVTAEKMLIQAMPELSDGKRKAEFVQNNREYLLSQGFSDAEANSVFDHRALIQIDKARRYDAAVAKAAARKARGGDAPSIPSINQAQTAPTPANTQTSKVRKAEDKLSSSGDINDAVDVLLARRNT